MTSPETAQPPERPTGERTPDERSARPRDRRGLAFDLLAVAAGTALVTAAALVGWDLLDQGVKLFMWFPPILASWAPQVGPGSVAAIVLGALVVLSGPPLAARLRWGVLLACGWGVSAAWTTSLALIDGFERGIAGPLASKKEYLSDVGRVTDIPRMLAGFSEHILAGADNPWSMHVGAHPPGALLVFVWLDRIGLGGGAAAGLFCILLGSSACVAVAVTLRALGHEGTARTLLPFGVLFPGAVWVGVSADGMFAGVLAWGVALLAVGAAGRGPRADLAAAASGLVLGYTLYLSYGLVLGGLLPLAVFALTRNWRALLISGAGVGAVVAAFTASGFWWLTGYEHLRVIYADSVAKHRPDQYFLWANLAALLFALGPAALAGLRRLLAHPRRLPTVTVLAGAALVAVLIADATGMSKGEVERIWLPFAVWLLVPCALLPRTHARWWLAAQATLPLLVCHLLYTPW